MISLNLTLLDGTLLCFASGSILGVVECFRLRKRFPDLKPDLLHRRPGLLWVLLFCGIVWFCFVFSCLIFREILWYLPPELEIRLSLITYSVLSLISAFILGMLGFAMWREKQHSRSLRNIRILGFVVFFGLIGLQWKNDRVIWPDLNSARPVAGEPVMQTTGSSCAPASAANIAGLLGISMSEQEAGLLIGTTARGSSAGQIILGLRQAGMDCIKFVWNSADLRDMPVPAMIFVDHPATGPESHAVALIRFDPVVGTVEIWDPLEGKLHLNSDGLRQIWRGRGLEIRLTEFEK